MRLSILLLILCIGCGTKAVVKPAVPVAPIVLSPVPVAVDLTIPIRKMDSLHAEMGDVTVAFIKIEEEVTQTSVGETRQKIAYTYCAGVWVSLDEILTAAHCVKDDEKPWLVPVGEEVLYVVKSEVDSNEVFSYHHGKVSSFDDSNDLVLVRVVGLIPRHVVVKLANELPAVGERVYGVGHPAKLNWSFISGEVSAYRKKEDLGRIIQTNMSIWYGNSGGGLFDRDGKLIGICAQKLEVPSMGYYVILDNIKSFLEEARIRRIGLGEQKK